MNIENHKMRLNKRAYFQLKIFVETAEKKELKLKEKAMRLFSFELLKCKHSLNLSIIDSEVKHT